MELSLDEIIRTNPDKFKIKKEKKNITQSSKTVQTFLSNPVTTSNLRRRVETNSPNKKVIVSKTLNLSNLHSGVLDSDLKELFSEFGKIESVRMHHDQFGHFLGVADINFLRSADAAKAMSQYNGVPLDGRDMIIKMVGNSDIGIDGKVVSAIRGGGNGRRFGTIYKPNQRKRSGAQKKRIKRMNRAATIIEVIDDDEEDVIEDVEMKDVTIEKLDAEMDEYNLLGVRGLINTLRN